MKEAICNIWDRHAEKKWICVTTNYGWRPDHWAVMGAGVALQARDRYPEIAREYGKFCFNYCTANPDTVNIDICPFPNHHIICFATKSLDVEKPWLSWKQSSSIEQIIHSCKSLVDWMTLNKIVTNIYLPRPGCQNGGLSWKFVKNHIHTLLPDNVIVVSNQP
jgi:hypothetical protein